jgi:arylsulfatase A-like enzyme
MISYIKSIAKTGLMAAALGSIISPPMAWCDEASQSSPNFIVFYIDDLGWMDTSLEMMENRPDTRSHYYDTPNLVKFAKEGLTFSRAYASAPVCSPSRTALQHGTTPAKNRQATLHPSSVRIGEMAIPEALKQANPNYRSAHFGKWHVPCIDPASAGYEVSDGPTGNGEGDFMDDMVTLLPDDDPKRLFSLTRKSEDFIRQQTADNKPFYLQISHYAVHIWHNSLKSTREKYLKKKYHDPLPHDLFPESKVSESDFKHNWVVNYGAMIEDLDTVFGQLLDTLDELGISENTYVIFTSDNGGGVRGNGILKGAKGDLTEGGIRIPMVVRGPGVLQGAYTNVAAVQWDYLPTFYDLAGGTKALPESIDGGSLADVFEQGDKGSVQRNTEELIFHFPWYNGEPETAVQIGDFKLLKNLDTLETQFFKISEDPSENHNLLSSYSELASEYEKKLEKYLDRVDAEQVTDLRKQFLGNLSQWIPTEEKNLALNKEKAKSGDAKAQKEVERLIGYIKWMKGERTLTEKRIQLHENR